MNDVLVHDGPSGGSSAAPPEAPGRYDWFAIERALDRDGHAILPGLLSRPRCEALAGGYDCNASFRSTIVMARHAFGRGEYKYFRYPLPPVLEVLRHALYLRLAVIANRWNARLGSDTRFPATLAEFLDRCHRAGQTRPTPLILKYGEGDYNCLHQDLYGEHVFPLQVAILLSRPGSDFAGGELVMTETRPGWQRADVVAIGQGDAVAFAVNQRPVTGFQGRTRRVAMRHGVSRVTRGQRHTVGLIFHDAR